MSLLIKALDHLDKNKQAEKSKKPTSGYVADEALMLELMPVEPKQVTEMEPPQAVEEKSEFSELVMLEHSSADSSTLSLEEEAGITGEHITAPKITKTKQSATNDKDSKTNKTIAKSTDQSVTKPSTQTAATSSTQTDTSKNIPPLEQPSSVSKSALTDQFKKPLVPQNTATYQKPSAPQNTATDINQKAAAKVFVANKAIKAPSSKFALVLLGLAGALLIWLGLQGYSYIKKLSAPDVIAVKPVVQKPSEPTQQKVAEDTPVAMSAVVPAEVSAEIVTPNQNSSPVLDESDVNASAGSKISAPAPDKKSEEKLDATEDEPKKSQTKHTRSNDDETYSDSDASFNAEPRTKGKRKPLKLISKESSSGVDPTLMAAYQAYSRGDDATAQQQYRQVLQGDVRNVDALLGMAAIAQRQGRDADASGWYYKVLEIDPKNTIAQSAMTGAGNTSQQANLDVARTESRIKNMLAQQPDSANAHAALGNLYAAQGQWPSAQQAYFNASRLAPDNADYAFNLAISLDQMGKTNLALQQYERALELLNKSGGSSPDRALLEARIHALR